VLDTIGGDAFHLFGAHLESALRGVPGAIIAQRDGAICRAAVDGAVWITHLKRPGHYKLPAVRALGHVHAPEAGGYREITYQEHAGVGYLHFNFYNGAMSTGQCHRLLGAYREARERDTRVLVLMGGPDFFSNGIHLNVIEADEDPAAESWRNLLAIDDLVQEIIQTTDKTIVSALVGDAAAGGVPLALAADHVLAHQDVILNPYYRHMGGLYGSEYWTYLLPRRIGPQMSARLTNAPFAPVGARRALEIGLIDAITDDVQAYAEHLSPDLAAKRCARARDEARKPLAAYRMAELARSHECFFGPDRSYHAARHRFVYKLPPKNSNDQP
jgi:putative two-component system hydrogenase maturation factor HypX/HoxX